VTGNRCSDVLGAAVVVGAALEPTDAPPVLAASAALALAPTAIRLQINALAIRTCKATTSFVGLRG
jgi:hypothetical protein